MKRLKALWDSLLCLLRDKSGDMPVPTFGGFKDLLSIDDLQTALGIGRSMAYRLVKDGSIRHLRIGKTIKIPKVHLVDYIEKACYNGGVAANLPSEEVK